MTEATQPKPTNRLRKLRHIAIVSVNPGKLSKFYEEVFGMEVVHSSKGGSVFMSDGTISLALLKNKAEGKPNGLNHIGFLIDDHEDVASQLEKWGLDRPVERPADRPYAEVRMTDPDGNNIDLSVHGFDRIETKAEREKQE
jgi:catechol-2,3-dioxygenase